MILQQAVRLGLIGFQVGKSSAMVRAPIFAKHVLIPDVADNVPLLPVLAVKPNIVVTHDEKFIMTSKRFYHIRDGRTEEEDGEGRTV
ncbi:hypothetical protein [Granulosicoccus sp. 3-233]|uniref:hypothetical protein n=1 Tax=Granulosicoccus sp. 3-233 TaxID=3417969 RepID=UPI003D32AF99